MGLRQMINVQPFLGSVNLTVSEAMRRIDENSCGILFLTDDGKLTGCVTDGDIRRFLLAGGRLSGSVMEAANHDPRVARTTEEARLLYHRKDYIIIPIVNDLGVVTDLYNGEEEEADGQGKKSLGLPVVINAGGKGTRLDPYTRILPKALIPVGDLPIMERIMLEYQSYACTDFHIIVNHKRDLVKAYFADNERNYHITWYDEEEPLGTGGGLSLLRGKLTSTFFFANCDTLLTADYEPILRFHREKRNVITMICARRQMVLPYGIVERGSDGSIEEMKEKPRMSFWTNTGIYIVEPEVIDDIEEHEATGFPDIIAREKQMGKKVAGFPVGENDWMDMGQLPELEKMRIRLGGELLF